jgi:hypothetical protein
MKLALLFGAAAAMEANPIRKVVMLMQDMQKEIEAEGDKEKDLYEKFMCYCKGGTADMDKEAADAAARAEAQGAKAKSDAAEKAQLDQELVDHKKDRADAKQALATATELRAKENKAFEESNADNSNNLEAMGQAIAALEKGMGAGFLQTDAAKTLKLAISQMDVEGRETVMGFLQKDYAPQGGEIVGILKNMKDVLEKDMGEELADEKQAATTFGELKAAKRKEIQAATDAIESKTARSGQLAVSIVQAKQAAKDATRELGDAQRFAAELSVACKEKTDDWNERSKTRADELVAISEAMKILNGDDALEVFNASNLKKPAVNPVGFLQKSNRRASHLNKARTLISQAVKGMKAIKNPALNLLAQAVVSKMRSQENSGNVDFSTVLKMIDDMVDLLKKEQADDEKHRDWCNGEFDTSEGEHKDTTRNLNDLTATIEEAQNAIEELSAAIDSTNSKIADIDKSVAEASAQRQAEHAEYQDFKRMNEAAKQLLFQAKNRLNKFYNPNLYVKPKERELSRNDQIFAGAGGELEAEPVVDVAAQALAGFIQLHKRSHQVALAPEKPEAPEEYGEFKKKSGSSNSVTALMDSLTAEVDKGLQEAEHDEKTAVRDYEKLVADAKENREGSSKTLTQQQEEKAATEGLLQESKEKHTLTTDKLNGLNSYIADLHKSCDFIIANFEMRREARTNEREGLQNAKAVLSGSDYQ